MANDALYHVGPGTISTAGSGATASFACPCANSGEPAGAISVFLSGTWAGATLIAEGDPVGNGANWVPLQFVSIPGSVQSDTILPSAGGAWLIPHAGMAQVRVRATALASGAITVDYDVSKFAADYAMSAGRISLFNGTSYDPLKDTGPAGAANVHLASAIAGEDGSGVGGEGATVMKISPKAMPSIVGCYTNFGNGTKVGAVGINLKAAAGRIRAFDSMLNTHATAVYYMLLVDKASPPIAGDTPIDVVVLPAASVAIPSRDYGEVGKSCSLGLSYAVSTSPTVVALPATSDVLVFGRWI